MDNKLSIPSRKKMLDIINLILAAEDFYKLILRIHNTIDFHNNTKNNSKNKYLWSNGIKRNVILLALFNGILNLSYYISPN